MPLLDQFDPSRWQPRGTYDDVTPYASQPFTLPVAPQSWWGSAQDYLGTGAQQLGQGVGNFYGNVRAGDLDAVLGDVSGAADFAGMHKPKIAKHLGLLGKGYQWLTGDK